MPPATDQPLMMVVLAKGRRLSAQRGQSGNRMLNHSKGADKNGNRMCPTRSTEIEDIVVRIAIDVFVVRIDTDKTWPLRGYDADRLFAALD